MKTIVSTILFSLFTISLFGVNITVSNTNDSGANSLREAITTANGNGQDDVITITATGTIMLASDLPIISTNIVITGPGAANLTIDGVDTYKIFEITGSSTVVTLEEMTITKGKGKTTSIPDFVANSLHGGGIFSDEATITVNDCTITNHTQSEYGGGYFNLDGSATFNTCTFTGNIAQETGVNNGTGRAGVGYTHADSGKTANTTMNNCTMNNNSSEDMTGALEVASRDEDINDAILTLNNCTVNNNSADRDGGAIGILAATIILNNCNLQDNTDGSGGGALVLGNYNSTAIGSKGICTNTTFSGNTSFTGGAIYLFDNSDLTLQNCVLTNNSAANTNGGAIYNKRGTITIDQSTFQNNQANGSAAGSTGGAIFTLNNTVTITNSTFSGNSATYEGGAIDMENGTVNIDNCTFNQNTSKRFGGAIDMYGGTMNLKNCTIVENIADSDNSSTPDIGGYGSGEGGGISEFGPGVVTITNCIIANNTLGSGAADDLYSDNTISSGGHNLVKDAAGLTTGTDDITGQDPNLAALADNGGAVQTFAPNTGSPAIDHVDNGSAPCTDARLATRTGNADIGAYESGGTFGDVSVAVAPASVAENSGTDLVYTYTRTGNTCGNLLVNFSVGGSATLNTDYAASNHTGFSSSAGSVIIPDGSSAGTLNVTPIDNADMDGDKTVVLEVTSGDSYNIAGSNFSITGTITDDESPSLPSVTIATGSAQSENSNTAIQYTFTRTGDNSATLTVKFSIDDANSTASAGEYNVGVTGGASLNFPTTPFNGEITFMAGSSTAILTITPVGDMVIEANETVVVKVEP